MTREVVESDTGTRKHIVQEDQDDMQGYLVYCGHNHFRGDTEKYDDIDDIQGLCGNCEHIYKSSRK